MAAVSAVLAASSAGLGGLALAHASHGRPEYPRTATAPPPSLPKPSIPSSPPTATRSAVFFPHPKTVTAARQRMYLSRARFRACTLHSYSYSRASVSAIHLSLRYSATRACEVRGEAQAAPLPGLPSFSVRAAGDWSRTVLTSVVAIRLPRSRRVRACLSCSSAASSAVRRCAHSISQAVSRRCSCCIADCWTSGLPMCAPTAFTRSLSSSTAVARGAMIDEGDGASASGGRA